MRNQSQSAMQNVGQSAGVSQQRTSEKARRRKRKCAGVNVARMLLGVIAIVFVIVITGVQASGWEAINDALFGHITAFEVIRQAAIVILSICVGWWIKKPYKVYIKGNEKQQSEAEQKAEE